jgi:hypothetical protein
MTDAGAAPKKKKKWQENINPSACHERTGARPERAPQKKQTKKKL